MIAYVPHSLIEGHPKPWENIEIQVLKFRQKCKSRVQNEDETANEVFTEELSNLRINSGFTTKAISTNRNYREFHVVKSGLQKRKTKYRLKLPTSLKDMIIDGNYLLTNEGEKYLILNLNNKI